MPALTAGAGFAAWLGALATGMGCVAGVGREDRPGFSFFSAGDLALTDAPLVLAAAIEAAAMGVAVAGLAVAMGVSTGAANAGGMAGVARAAAARLAVPSSLVSSPQEVKETIAGPGSAAQGPQVFADRFIQKTLWLINAAAKSGKPLPCFHQLEKAEPADLFTQKGDSGQGLKLLGRTVQTSRP